MEKYLEEACKFLCEIFISSLLCVWFVHAYENVRYKFQELFSFQFLKEKSILFWINVPKGHFYNNKQHFF